MTAANTYKTGADADYALSCGLWKGPDKTLCGIEFYVAAITGNISSKICNVQIYSTDSNKILQTLKRTPNEIPSSILARDGQTLLNSTLPLPFHQRMRSSLLKKTIS